MKSDQKGNESFVRLDEHHTTVVIFCSVVAIVLALRYYQVRLGFDNPFRPILATLGISLFVLCLPIAFRSLVTKLGLSLRESWLTSYPFFLLSGLVTLIVTGFITSILRINISLIFAVIGALFFGLSVVEWLLQGKLRQGLLLLVAATLFSYWLGATLWGAGYTNPLFEEKVGLGLNIQDTTFHIAIANMIRSYQVPSTGLDGVRYLNYHYGSHLIFAQLSNLLKLRLIDFYQLGYPIIFLPFFLCSLLVSALAWKPSSNVPSQALRSNGWFWGVFFLAFINFLPQYVTLRAKLGTSYLISESFLVGLSLSFLLLGLLARDLGHRLLRFNRHSAQDIALYGLILPILLGCIGFTKVSLMILLYALVFYLFVRLKLYKYRLAIGSLIVCTMVVFVVYRLVSLTDSSYLQFSLFGDIRNDIAGKLWIFWFFIFFIWSWLFVILRLYSADVKTIEDLEQTLTRKRFWDVEIVILIALLGAGPNILFAIPGESGFYFMDFQRWLSVTLILSNVGVFAAALKSFTSSSQLNLSANWRRRLIFSLLVLLFAVFVIDNYWRPVNTERRQRQNLIHALAENEGPEYIELIRTFRDLDQLPLRNKSQTLLYIPYSNKQYWDIHPICTNTPFIAPALSGIALLDGLPDAECKAKYYKYYGYWTYELRTHPREARAASIQSLCEETLQRGFSQLVTLDSDSTQNVLIDFHDCSHLGTE